MSAAVFYDGNRPLEPDEALAWLPDLDFDLVASYADAKYDAAIPDSWGETRKRFQHSPTYHHAHNSPEPPQVPSHPARPRHVQPSRRNFSGKISRNAANLLCMGYRKTVMFALSTAALVVLGVGIAFACYQCGFIDGLQSCAESVNRLEAELADLRHWRAVEHPGESIAFGQRRDDEP